MQAELSELSGSAVEDPVVVSEWGITCHFLTIMLNKIIELIIFIIYLILLKEI